MKAICNIMVAFNRTEIAQTGNAPSGFKLIRDTCPMKVLSKQNVIVEGLDGREEKALKIKSLLQRGNAINENGRYYDTQEILIPAVNEIAIDIQSRSVMGEFDHPESLKVNLDRVSHLMTNIWMDGKECYGEAEILHRTPHGAALRGLLEHDVRVGISSRGAGQLEQTEIDGTQIILVLEGFRFITWDVVAKPSVSDAILQISESLERKLNPIQKQQNKLVKKFGSETYNKILVQQINKFFEIE